MKLSLVLCVWNTSHLLKRSIEYYCRQDFPKDDWELIVVDDNSEDDVQEAIKFAVGKININYIRLTHNFGMRGNTVAFNKGFELARGKVLAESTPETILTTDFMRKLYEPHEKYDRVFVAGKTWNITKEVQAKIDSVDWREDLGNIMTLDGFFNDWTLNNLRNTHFGTHQTCSIRKEVFYEMFPKGYPLFSDYGSEDPHFCGQRSLYGVRDITIMQPMAMHQWHATWDYWTARGKAPMLNKFGHSMSNFQNDTSGKVPQGGTCEIWDGGSHEQMSEEEKNKALELDYWVKKTGCNI